MGSCTCSAAGPFDRFMRRGDTFIFDLVIPEDATDSCSPPKNLTGYEVWFTAKEHYGIPDSQASIRLGTLLPLTGVVITSAYEGKVRVTVPATATVNFPDTSMTLFYDVQIKDTLGQIFTVESGTLTVEPDVTRAIS